MKITYKNIINKNLKRILIKQAYRKKKFFFLLKNPPKTWKKVQNVKQIF